MGSLRNTILDGIQLDAPRQAAELSSDRPNAGETLQAEAGLVARMHDLHFSQRKGLIAHTGQTHLREVRLDVIQPLEEAALAGVVSQSHGVVPGKRRLPDTLPPAFSLLQPRDPSPDLKSADVLSSDWLRNCRILSRFQGFILLL
jgi:hypothetical protein